MYKALKAEVDQGAWAALNTTRSRPYDAPKTGKIAVKLINDFGDEVLKVYSVDSAQDEAPPKLRSDIPWPTFV